MADRFDEGGEGFEREIVPLVREPVMLLVEPCFAGLLGISSGRVFMMNTI